MKKKLLTLAFIAGSIITANAQNVRFSAEKMAEPSEVLQKQSDRTRETATLQTEMSRPARIFMDGNKRLVKRAAEETVSLFYGFPAGAFYYGLMDDGGSYTAIYMITGAFKDVTFDNYSKNSSGERITDVEWSWPSGSPMSGTQVVDEYGNLTAQVFGIIKFPVMTVGTNTYGTVFQNSKDKDVNAYWNGGIDNMGDVTVSYSDGTEENTRISISNACIQYGSYSGFGEGYEFTSNQNFNKFGNGQNWTDTGKKTVGFAQIFEKPLGFVYAGDVNAWFWTEGIDAASPLSGKTLKATICTFDENGSLVPYANATASDADATAVGKNGLYNICFKFMEEDPVLGSVEAPIALPEEDFIVLLTGFGDITGKFTATFANAGGVDGYGYSILEDGSLATIAYTNSSSPQVNLHIGFHAAVPVAELAYPETGIAVVPDAGGYAVTGTADGKNYTDVDIYTLNTSENWIVEKPDWIEEVEFSDELIDRGILMAHIKGQPLPSTIDKRSDKVTFTLFGKTVEVTVNQGNVSSGISTIESESTNKNEALYNIAGQKVNKDYKGLVIKNGKKFVNNK